MGYDFRIDGADIILDSAGSSRNYGRNFIVQMPIVLWYACRQFGYENLFEMIDLPDSISKVEEESTKRLDSLIDSVIHASLRLPKSLEGENGINADLHNWGISSFKSDNDNYKISIEENSLDILRDDKLDISILNYALLMKFAPNYFGLIGEW
jgi:hypothetical protein